MRDRSLLFRHEYGSANRRTFTIPPIRKFIRRYSVPGPTYDIFPYRGEDGEGGRGDALDDIRKQPDASAAVILYDPVYSQHQADTTYGAHGEQKVASNNPGYFWKLEREILRVCRPRGRVLKFGWNSRWIRGFDLIGGLLVEHGAWRNDTICTAFERVQERLAP